LIGKSGAGKTNLLNHLCQSPIFTARVSVNSQTTRVQKAVIKSKISDRRNVSFEIFDTPGLFDTTLKPEVIEATMKKFFLYDCSQVHLVFIMIKQERITDEFKKLIEKSLAMFKKGASKIIRIIITNCEQKTRLGYMKDFFQHPFIVQMIKDWKFRQENFIFVDLDLREKNYVGATEDVRVMCRSLMDSSIAYHKTEVFSQFEDAEFKTMNDAITNPVKTMYDFWSKKEKK